MAFLFMLVIVFIALILTKALGGGLVIVGIAFVVGVIGLFVGIATQR